MKSHKIVNTPTATKNDCKAFATNQTVAMHCLDDPLEYIRERISLAEALVAVTRKRRMIRDGILDAGLVEPTLIGSDAYGDQERLVVLMVILFLRVGQVDRLPSCGC
jgi:hypothetical protein